MEEKYMDIMHWKRLAFGEKTVWVLPQAPDWIIPNSLGDGFFQTLQKNRGYLKKDDLNIFNIKERQFVRQVFASSRPKYYPGRSEFISLSSLKECWFHITDRCNLSCRHCLFSCSPSKHSTMPLNSFTSYFDQAFELGARTFFLTGGEPMIHPDFKKICKTVLDKSMETRLVILTNGLMMEEFTGVLKSLPLDRIFFQVSMDGDEKTHEKIRGKGTHKKLLRILSSLSSFPVQVTLAMAVSRDNLALMPDIVDIADQYGIFNIHYLWMLAVGKSKRRPAIPSRQLLTNLMAAHKKADRHDIIIDNIQSIEGQVFSPQGTKYDLGNAGWESIAIAPDGDIYPTPALIGEKEALCGNACNGGVGHVWQHSQRLSQIREMSIMNDQTLVSDPLKFLTGGPDLDHRFYNSGGFAGRDPYVELYNQIALWRMTDAVDPARHPLGPCILMKMGDRLLNCDDTHGQVALTHSNCVLSLSTLKAGVSGFYSTAAKSFNEDIINPVCYPEEEISHIPLSSRIRSYGCGSPVMDAGIQVGETLVDLGSGAGTECFIAARKVGKTGKIFGVDMTGQMLDLARASLGSVEKNLGYKNIEFKKAFLENIPLDDGSVDVVISNCVINLSGDKHQTFEEIFRILKSGGRIVISDIVTDTVPDPAILNDTRLRGECIAGALTQTRLLALLELTGFIDMTIAKRFFYRQVAGHLFYSITYQAFKPDSLGQQLSIVYPGPFAAVVTDRGDIILRGEKKEIEAGENTQVSKHLFILDDNGNVANREDENTCACYLPLKTRNTPPASLNNLDGQKSMTGCMQCGRPLQYFSENKLLVCSHCGLKKTANAVCEKGHFICDTCHSKDAYKIVTDICLNTVETDMIRLLNVIRNHPAMPLHGPEHHFAVPGVIVAAYKNIGGAVTDQQIISAIERGKAIPGGTCGFWGSCGAALGVGIAYGIILKSNPIKAAQRRTVQQVVGDIIQQLALVKASRCCQRESWTSLMMASEMSGEILPVSLPVDTNVNCTQMGQNKECAANKCRFFKKPQTVSLQTL